MFLFLFMFVFMLMFISSLLHILIGKIQYNIKSPLENVKYYLSKYWQKFDLKDNLFSLTETPTQLIDKVYFS